MKAASSIERAPVEREEQNAENSPKGKAAPTPSASVSEIMKDASVGKQAR